MGMLKLGDFYTQYISEKVRRKRGNVYADEWTGKKESRAVRIQWADRGEKEECFTDISGAIQGFSCDHPYYCSGGIRIPRGRRECGSDLRGDHDECGPWYGADG